MTQNTDPKKWREFEKLVARIEQAAGPAGVTVTSPDYLLDQITGDRREVDACIRYKVGTTTVVITVECRRRGRKQDVRWIEELVSKRTAICASKTIAVASGGFSRAAQTLARHHGIDLRVLSTVTAAELKDWFIPDQQVTRVFADVMCVLALPQPDARPMRYLRLHDLQTPAFAHVSLRTGFSANDLLSMLARTHHEHFTDVPLDGTAVPWSRGIRLEGGDLAVQIGGRLWLVDSAWFSAKVMHKTLAFELAEGSHHQYTTSVEDGIRHTSFGADLFGIPVRFEHQADSLGNTQVSFVVPSNDFVFVDRNPSSATVALVHLVRDVPDFPSQLPAEEDSG